MWRVFVLLMFPLVAFASGAPVSFDFSGVSLIAFGQATFKNIMQRDFVIAPEVMALDRRISVSVRGIDPAQVPAFVEDILAQQGISTTQRDGIYYLGVKAVHRSEVVSSGSGGDAGAAAVAAPMVASDALAGRVLHDASKGVEVDGRFAGRSNDEVSEVYVAVNRPSAFLVAVIAAGFGSRSAVLAGSRIVVTGSKKEVAKILALLSSIDVAAPMVDVSASWVEVTRTSGSARGIALAANLLGARFGVSLGSVSSASAVSLRNTNFQLVIDALNSDGRFHQVSNSRLVGDDYEHLTLTVGDETPTISSTGRDNAGNAVQNVVYRPSGVILDVLPRVLNGGRINLGIDGQISSFKPTATGVVGSPTLIKRQVKTNVTVVDGDVLLIGGLNDVQDSDSSSALAFLPSWISRSGSKAETDLVLVLSAKVVRAN